VRVAFLVQGAPERLDQVGEHALRRRHRRVGLAFRDRGRLPVGVVRVPVAWAVGTLLRRRPMRMRRSVAVRSCRAGVRMTRGGTVSGGWAMAVPRLVRVRSGMGGRRRAMRGGAVSGSGTGFMPV
jgi:hypothetical protein